MSNIIMKGKDTVSAQLAECYVTIEGNRYNFMQAIDLEAKMEKTKTEGGSGARSPQPARRASFALRSIIP